MSRPENEAVGSDMETGRRGIWQAWALLLIGLMATALVVRSTKSDAEADAKREFDFVCNEIQTKMSDRLRAHEQILRSAAAFLDRSNAVNRQEWRRFTERQKVEQQLPGIQGIGFALLIPPQKLEQHVQQIRAEGFSTYQVRPAGEREIYSSIIYLEPFTNRNLRAFGYDMLSEPTRRAAMERARDRDVAALSGKVVLVQETEQDVQAGALMYVPVYRPGMPAETIPQRREAILGWVYSPYRMDDLMQGILGGWDLAGQKRIRLEIFDGGMESPDALLYDSQPAKGQKKPSELPLAMQSGIVYAGHQWTLHFTRTGGQALAMDYGKVWLVLFGGISTSLLLSGLFYSLLNTRFKAMQIARKLTAELRSSEMQFREVLENSLDASFKRDLRTNTYDYLSPVFARLSGFSPEEMKNLPLEQVLNLIHPDDLAEVKRVIAESLAASTVAHYQVEYRFKHKDGFYRWFQDGFTLTRDAQGHPLAFIGSVSDITERKRIAAAADALSTRNKVLLQMGSDGIHVLDGQGNVMEVNDAFCGMLGYSREELLRLHVKDWDAQWPAEELPMRIRRWMDSPGMFETRHRTKDGRLLQVEINARGITLDNHTHLYASARDITERKRMESSLRLSEERLALAMKATQEAIWDWDLLANSLYYSPAWWSMLGYGENELKADPDLWHRLMHPDDLDRAAQIVSDAIAGKECFDVEVRVLHKDGHYVPIHTRGFVLRDDTGTPVRVSGTNTDLTERKRMEDERMQWERQGQRIQKAESLARMAGAIAHIFNNQLMAVMLSLDMIRSAVSRDQDSSEILAMAFQAARRASEVSSLMLIYLGQTTSKQEPLDISAVCRQHLPILRADIPNTAVLETDLPSPGPTVIANASQIHLVLTHLIANAWQASGDKPGTIRLTVKTVASADISAKHHFPLDSKPKDKLHACLEVADSGCGIPVNDIEKIFDPFFSTKFTGRGLGLAVVLGIVRAHNGVVTVESEPGRGSVFRVFLPASTEVAAQQLP